MVTPNRSSKIVVLSEFTTERTALQTISSSRIAARQINQINFDIHDNYKLEDHLINERLDAITNKFRKCQMAFYLYFDELDHEILVGRSTNLPLSRECVFQSTGGVVKQYFEVTEKTLYQELIDYHFQEFILFTSSVLENLVYLSETLVRKVSIHPKKSAPLSIPLKNYMELLDYLHRLNYRNPADPIAACLRTHQVFLDRFLPTINTFRNRFIHGYTKRLIPTSYEYVLSGAEAPFSAGSPDLAIDVFTRTIVSNLEQFIPQFFDAIAITISSAAQIPA